MERSRKLSSRHLAARQRLPAVLTQLSKGLDIDEALNLKNTDIAAYLHLPPIKLHCSMLAEDAVKAAIRDYKKKNEKIVS